jgi:hypothetical protein
MGGLSYARSETREYHSGHSGTTDAEASMSAIAEAIVSFFLDSVVAVAYYLCVLSESSYQLDSVDSKTQTQVSEFV